MQRSSGFGKRKCPCYLWKYEKKLRKSCYKKPSEPPPCLGEHTEHLPSISISLRVRVSKLTENGQNFILYLKIFLAPQCCFQKWLGKKFYWDFIKKEDNSFIERLSERYFVRPISQEAKSAFDWQEGRSPDRCVQIHLPIGKWFPPETATGKF